jgi:hypothetical protein
VSVFASINRFLGTKQPPEFPHSAKRTQWIALPVSEFPPNYLLKRDIFPLAFVSLSRFCPQGLLPIAFSPPPHSPGHIVTGLETLVLLTQALWAQGLPPRGQTTHGATSWLENTPSGNTQVTPPRLFSTRFGTPGTLKLKHFHSILASWA